MCTPLLSKGLEEVATGVLVLRSNDGVVVEMNAIASTWLMGVIKKGDIASENLRDLKGSPVDLILVDEGMFGLGSRHVYRFMGREFENDGCRYRSVCFFDTTESYIRLTNAEQITKMALSANKQTLETFDLPEEENPSSTDASMDEFVKECSIDTGLGFGEDDSAAMVSYSEMGVAMNCNKNLRGFTPQEIIGHDSYDHIHPDDIAKTASYHKGLLDDPRKIVPVYIMMRKLHKNGSYVPIEMIGAYHAGENGKSFVSGCERVINIDRTKRLVSNLTDQIPCGIVIVDSATGVTEMSNSVAQSWLNLKKGDHFVKHMESLSGKIFSREESTDLLTGIRQCMLQHVDYSRKVEVTVKTLAGRIYSFTGMLSKSDKKKASPTAKKKEVDEMGDMSAKLKQVSIQRSGSPVDVILESNIIWVINDVTHMSDALEQQHSAILSFMRCTSHEMRTPMQAISLAAHSLSEAVGDSKADIDTIIASSAILETIMSNILEFKNITSMQFEPVTKVVNINENLNRIVDVLQHSTIIAAGVVLSAEFQWEGTQYIMTDNQMIDRIMLNLVSNALKFTTEGEVRIEVSMGNYDKNNEKVSDVTSDSSSSIVSMEEDAASTQAESGDVSQEKNAILHIKVIDTGCGMDKASQAKIGEYDFSDSSGAVGGIYQGFGLGTYIVRNYIKALGGSFKLQSEVGLGTTVFIDIPTRYADEDTELFKKDAEGRRKLSKKNTGKDKDATGSSPHRLPPTPEVRALPPKTSSSSLPKKLSNPNMGKLVKSNSLLEGIVLVVEDIAVNRKLIVKALQRGGFKVDQAENGAIALDMMLKNKYRTVFMDINMPVMNGDVAVREYWKRKHQLEEEENTRLQQAAESELEKVDIESDHSSASSSVDTPTKSTETNSLKKSRSIKQVRTADDDLRNSAHPKIIMLTGNITDADRDMALACGAHQFMTKPVVPKQLWDAASWSLMEEESPRSSTTSPASSRGRSISGGSTEFPTCL